MINTRSSR